jgi:hypothetical protein
MTGHAKWAIFISLLAAAAAVALAVAIAPAWSPTGIEPLFLLFLAGPLAFLALMTWRRREHPTRSKLLFGLAAVLAAGGLGVLAYDYVRFRSEQPGQHATHLHPLIIPLVQWLAVVAVWIVLVVKEGREKRAAQRTT